MGESQKKEPSIQEKTFELTSEIPSFQARLAALNRDLKAISTSWAQPGVGFQAESKQVTSLEVITQVGYLAGQTNKAASWHLAARSKPPTDRATRKQRPVGSAPPLVHSGSLVYMRMCTCVVFSAVCPPTLLGRVLRVRLKDGEQSESTVTLTVESACETAVR